MATHLCTHGKVCAALDQQSRHRQRVVRELRGGVEVTCPPFPLRG
jgi:hypothetical protein